MSDLIKKINLNIQDYKENSSTDKGTGMLYIGDSNQFFKHEHFFLDHLSEEEKLRAEKFAFQSDRLTYICAHYFLRLKIGQLLGLQPEHVDILQTYMQKPLLNNYPIDFNLSHTKSFFAFLISTDSNSKVGIDIEISNWQLNIADIMHKYMHPEEVKYITEDQTNQKLQSQRFLKIWTRKEAFLKMTGIGLINNLQDINMINGIRILEFEFPNHSFIPTKEVIIETICLNDCILSWSVFNSNIKSILWLKEKEFSR